MILYSYILSASKNPDEVSCKVPYKLNNKEETIFFGPCKRDLRKKLAKDSNIVIKKSEIPARDIYVMGFNGSNPDKIRKIVWIGKIKQIFTFDKARNQLQKKTGFEELFTDPFSPLHVKSFLEDNNFGYERVSRFHEGNNFWVTDIANRMDDVIIKGKKFYLKPGETRQTLTKDCCFICENLFFAEGEGIAIDNELSILLKKALELKYPDRAKSYSDYSIFGKTKNNLPYGFPGKWLEIEDETLIKTLVSLILAKKSRVKKLRKYSDSHQKDCQVSCDDEDNIDN